ncbi:hypothetical protein KCU93_g4180, partial [Aureobasidium melanogenum]
MLNSSSRDMAEIAKMIDDIVGTMESWSGALNALEETSEIHKELVNDYSMVREDTIPEAVLDAAARCASSGAKLATAEEIREVGTKQHVRMAKRDWDKVKGRYERFRNNVRLLHDLAQQLLAKRLIETTSSIESLIERQTQFHALHDRGSVCNRVFDMNLDSAGANYQPDMERVLGESTFMHDALQYQTLCYTDEVPYDILLGNEFIVRNRVFEPQRTVLALRYKHRSAAQREEEERRNRDHEMLATLEQQRIRAEDALKRAQVREAKKKAKLQTPASSMHSSDTSAGSKTDASTTPDSTVDTLVKIGSFRCQMTNLPIGNSVNGD